MHICVSSGRGCGGGGGGGGGVCVCVWYGMVWYVCGGWVGVSVGREQLRKEKIGWAVNLDITLFTFMASPSILQLSLYI